MGSLDSVLVKCNIYLIQFTFTSYVWVSLVTGRADAINTVDSLPTFSIQTAFGGVASAFLSAASFVWITRCARITDAAVR